MSVVFGLIALSLLVAAGFLAGFIWAVRSGQFRDTATPALRILAEDPPVTPPGERDENPKHNPTDPSYERG